MSNIWNIARMLMLFLCGWNTRVAAENSSWWFPVWIAAALFIGWRLHQNIPAKK